MNKTITTYENLSREELITTVVKLKHELDQFKRLVFGSRHEKFIPTVAAEQLALDLAAAEKQLDATTTQTVSYTRTITETPKKKESSVRMKLPADLPREVIVIEPTEDVTGCKQIGDEITEELEYTPGHFFVRQFKRPKYIRLETNDEKTNILIGTLPVRLIDKGIAGPGLLAQIMIDKYMDHLPLYRQIERFKRAGITFPDATLSDWVSRCSQELEVLYSIHRDQVLNSSYLQADETTIKVLDKDKKGKTHLGYYWVYRAPLKNMVLFDYRQGRGGGGPQEVLKNYKGYLQTDGYEVYEHFGKTEGITLTGCMAHARRKFIEAQNNDSARAEYILTHMKTLYELERQAQQEQLTVEKRYALRQEKALPILDTLHEWMKYNYQRVTPQSPIGKAIAYSLQRWDKLCVYTTNGALLIDNNLVENSIRPVALGRKNYLFAGSHNAAQRSAMIYSLLGTCRINNINPYDWLRDVFEKIPTHPINKIEDLLPHNWKQSHLISQ